MLSTRLVQLFKRPATIEAKAPVKVVEEIKRITLDDANFLKLLDEYREKLVTAEKKDLATLTKDSLDTYFKNYQLTSFQQALVLYTASLIYNTDYDAVQDKCAYMFFDFHKPGNKEQFLKNQHMFVNHSVLHLDPMNLIVGMRNPDAHLMLDANQAHVVGMFDNIAATFASMVQFPYLTPVIIGYLVHDFYLPSDRFETEIEYKKKLIARQEEVKAFDHILDPVLQMREEPITAVLEKSLADYENNRDYLDTRIMDITPSEEHAIDDWKKKVLFADEKEEKNKLEINKLQLKAKFYHREEGGEKQEIECLKQAVSLYGGISNCPVSLACWYYQTLCDQVDDELNKNRVDFRAYLDEKVAKEDPVALHYKALELLQKFETLNENDKYEMVLLFKRSKTARSYLRLLMLTKYQFRNLGKYGYYHYLEIGINLARLGCPASLAELAEEKVNGEKNEKYLRVASRFSRNASLDLVNDKFTNVLQRGFYHIGEFEDIMSLCEQSIAFGPVDLMNYFSESHNQIFNLGRSKDPEADKELGFFGKLKFRFNSSYRERRTKNMVRNVKIKTAEELFATLNLHEQMQMLYVTIRLDPMPDIKRNLIARFNSLATEEGALDCIPDPLNLDFLDESIKDKLKVSSSIVALTKVHGTFKDKPDEKGSVEVKASKYYAI